VTSSWFFLSTLKKSGCVTMFFSCVYSYSGDSVRLYCELLKSVDRLCTVRTIGKL